MLQKYPKWVAGDKEHKKVLSLVFWFVKSSSLVPGHQCFGRTSFHYFLGRSKWGWYVIGICRKCHKSDKGVQVDWPYRALRKVGEIQELSRPIVVMNLICTSCPNCVCVCACVGMLVLFLYFIYFVV